MQWNSMRWNRVRIALISGVMLAVFGATEVVRSCSEAPDVFDDFTIHPDEPLESYAAGRLGIVRPTFARSYLVVAYRYFSGVALTKDEQFAAAAVWENRLGYYSSYFSGHAPDADNPYVKSVSEPNDAVSAWLAARKEIAGTDSPAVESTKVNTNYVTYVNCSASAFRNAAQTLKDRAGKFGKTNPAVKDWIAAQDAVFANCSGQSQQLVLPAAADASLPGLLRYDREYQIAAAQMYSDQYEAAEKSFAAIPAEKDSPWHDLAGYLVARSMVRRALQEVPPPANPTPYQPLDSFDPAKMQQAEAFIQKSLQEGSNRSYAPALQRLLARVEYKLHPDQRQAILAALLRKPETGDHFYQSLWDYTWLLDERRDVLRDVPNPVDQELYAQGKPSREADELTDWVVNFQLPEAVSGEHSLAMWRAHRNSTAWLIAAISKTQPKDPQAAELLTAADAIPASSPAYITAFYHRMRLRNGNAKFKDTREAIGALLASKAEIPGTSREDLLDLRLDAASDLNDAMKFVVRHICTPEMMAQPSACPTALGLHAPSYLDGLHSIN